MTAEIPSPCPFCGAAPTLNVTRYRKELKIKPLFYLRCQNEACRVDVRAMNHSKRKLVADWNRRAER